MRCTAQTQTREAQTFWETGADNNLLSATLSPSTFSGEVRPPSFSLRKERARERRREFFFFIMIMVVASTSFAGAFRFFPLSLPPAGAELVSYTWRLWVETIGVFFLFDLLFLLLLLLLNILRRAPS